jgi:hypothetical protein
MTDKEIKEVVVDLRKKNRNKIKICGLCLEEQSTNWIRHWRKHHEHQIPFEADIAYETLTSPQSHVPQTTHINVSIFPHEVSFLPQD